MDRRLTERGAAFRRGATWTIDTPYRETVEEVRHYRREGVLTVEMEAAALFAVAAVRGVEAASVFVLSDLLGETEWTPEFGADLLGLREEPAAAVGKPRYGAGSTATSLRRTSKCRCGPVVSPVAPTAPMTSPAATG